MKRKKWTRSEKILWLSPGLLLVSAAGILYAPRLSRSLEARAEDWGFKTPGLQQRSTCIANLKAIGLATLVYANDHDGFFPPVATQTSDFGWAGLIRPFSFAVYHCPKNHLATSEVVTSPRYTNYYYNARLSNVSTDQLSSPAQTILLGEGTSSDARYSKTQLPPQWVNGPSSPARIHYEPKMATEGNANYAFADGHVNRMQPQFIGSGSPLTGGWTFALR